MTGQDFSVVTGGLGFTGKHIAAALLHGGARVRTLTNSPLPPPPGLAVALLDFARPHRLVEAMRGASVLYNTYWVRFDHGSATHAQAVRNSKVLVDAAVQAGVRRIVHVSITNPSLDSPLPYFRGKAEVEQAIRQSGLSYAILRPALLFGYEDILINNIAWLLRRAPIFAIAGDGRYRVQPIFVHDLAALAVEWGRRSEDMVIDAVGPEVFTFEELVRRIAAAIGRPARLLHLPPSMLLAAAHALGWLVADVLLTRDEIAGLIGDLLFSTDAPSGRTRLSDWLREHGERVGRCYASELARHYRRALAAG